MNLRKPGLQLVVSKSSTSVKLARTLTRLLKLQTSLGTRRTEALVSDLRNFASFFLQNFNSLTDIFWCPTGKFLDFLSCKISFKRVFETNQDF